MGDLVSGTSLRGSQPGARRRGFVVLLVALASVALAARLGLWQLDRAAQKVTLQAALDARSGLPVLDAGQLARATAAADVQHFRHVAVTGHWLAGQTIFLDNRQMDGKVGFFVVTPLVLSGSREAVLVQRGWAARHFDVRLQLPSIATPAGEVRVEGIVAPAPARLYEFTAAASGPIRQNLDLAAFAHETGDTLLPLSIQQLGEHAGDDLVRHWPAPTTDLQVHYGYAFQWFLIGAVIAFLYVWFRIVRPRQRRCT